MAKTWNLGYDIVVVVRNALGHDEPVLTPDGKAAALDSQEAGRVAMCAAAMEPCPERPLFDAKLQRRGPIQIDGKANAERATEPIEKTTPLHRDGSPITRQTWDGEQVFRDVQRPHPYQNARPQSYWDQASIDPMRNNPFDTPFGGSSLWENVFGRRR